jgi:hypothetical protein
MCHTSVQVWEKQNGAWINVAVAPSGAFRSLAEAEAWARSQGKYVEDERGKDREPACLAVVRGM